MADHPHPCTPLRTQPGGERVHTSAQHPSTPDATPTPSPWDWIDSLCLWRGLLLAVCLFATSGFVAGWLYGVIVKHLPTILGAMQGGAL